MTRLLEMTLHQFQSDGYPIQVRVPWLEQTLWFVPGPGDVERLRSRGVDRGRIWTARELTELYEIGHSAREHIRTLARIKVAFGGEVLCVTGITEGDGLGAMPPDTKDRTGS